MFLLYKSAGCSSSQSVLPLVFSGSPGSGWDSFLKFPLSRITSLYKSPHIQHHPKLLGSVDSCCLPHPTYSFIFVCLPTCSWYPLQHWTVCFLPHCEADLSLPLPIWTGSITLKTQFRRLWSDHEVTFPFSYILLLIFSGFCNQKTSLIGSEHEHLTKT